MEGSVRLRKPQTTFANIKFGAFQWCQINGESQNNLTSAIFNRKSYLVVKRTKDYSFFK